VEESQSYSKWSTAPGFTYATVCRKFTGIAPLIGPTTVKVVVAKVPEGMLAVSWILFGMLLAVTPTMERTVVVVMVWVV